VLVVFAVLGLAALVWWSSGRSRLDKADPHLRSASERFETDANRMRTMTNRNSPGSMGGPTF
jgi:hypothetical protein